MADHPLNLTLRFFLELVALWLLGMWGWSHQPIALGLALAVLTPGVAAAAWGVFRVPDDGGPPVVVVPGIVRLTLEVVVLGGAAWAAVAAGRPGVGLVFGSVAALHYALSWDRLGRLLRRRGA